MGVASFNWWVWLKKRVFEFYHGASSELKSPFSRSVGRVTVKVCHCSVYVLVHKAGVRSNYAYLFCPFT